MKKPLITFIQVLFLLSSFSLLAANDFEQQINAQRPDGISDLKWLGLKAAVQDTKIISNDGFFNNAVGFSVSLDPLLDRAVIGAFNAHDNGVTSGLAYVFELQNGNWIQTHKLMPFDAVAGQNFGRDVAIDGNWAVINAPTNSNQHQGAVYIFSYNGVEWVQYDKLVSTDTGPIENFGLSISLVGHQLLVSDISGNADTFTGAVYEYEFDKNTSQWSHISTITANDGLTSDLFGREIDLDSSGTKVVIGAPGVDEIASDAGAIYIFEKVGMVWSQSAKLYGSNTGINDRFGGKVAISGDTVVATGQFEIGEVYVFEKSGSWQESVVLTDSASSTGFGQSIDVDNDTIAIGYFYLDTSTLKKGFKTYEKSASIWTYQQNIEGTPGNGLGVNDLDIHGDRILASMYNIGAKYIENIPNVRLAKQGGNCVIFSCTWTDKGDLISSDTAQEDAFGIAVDVSGNRAIIGAYQDDDKGNNAGAAYIYEYKDLSTGESWVQIKKLTAADGEANDGFGRSVAIDGDRAIVGAYNDDHFDQNVNINIPNAGSVYVFEFDGLFWNQSEKLIADEGINAAGDIFGFTVDIDGNAIAVGAHFDDENGSNSGAAYIFNLENGNWTMTEKIMPADGNNDDAFGYAVSLDGNRVLIGAYQNDEVAFNTGAAYIFQYEPLLLFWQIQDKLLPAVTGTAGDFFGTAVSLDGDNALVGAFFDDTPVTSDNKGSVFFYQKDSNSDNWNQHQVITASDGDADDRFGYSVSLNGNRALIGSWLDDDNGLDSGSAYLFKLDTNALIWTESEKILPGDGDIEEYFGVSVALSDTWIMVGAHRDNYPKLDAGAVYVYVDYVIFEDGFE